jgi:magnesium-transporting ATPase (P-type)
MALLLWLGGGVALGAGMPQLAAAMWAVILINGLFSFWQEYRAERAAEALNRLLPQQARVLREGHEKQIPAEELVPGDVLILAEGDHVSADARIVEHYELHVDQSTLTGESHPVARSAAPFEGSAPFRCDIPNLLFAGTSVTSGTARAVVFATGMATELGRIAHLTQATVEEPSPLQVEMARVTRTVSYIAVGVGAVFFLLAVGLTGMTAAAGFLFALGMIAAFVPEGLLPTVTLSLAMGVQRMARRQALVKRLSAVETLGCATVICTDKTGTLTRNEMTAVQLWVSGRRLAITGLGYDPEGQILEGGRPVKLPPDPDLYRALLTAALCNDAHLEPPGEGRPHWSMTGDPTEAALLALALKGGLDLEALARKHRRLAEVPFTSQRRRMTTVNRQGRRRAAHVKGAPREVLALCTRLQWHGHVLPLDGLRRRQILETVDAYARQGLRVLALAWRPEVGADLESEALEKDLVFLGLVGLMDPPRPEVAEAAALCRKAGIRIIMITGDYGLTAESIARRVGLVGEAPVRVVTGAELSSLPEAELEKALAGEVLFARVDPKHKLRIVSALQRLGHVVAVTGDGVNDAPALRKADIGVAMGRTGSDVAREAADIVLADDSFASIVAAVEEGRAVYENIRRFVSYIFTSNVPEAVPFILHAFSGGRIPLALNVMQILSVDLGTDMMPALALGAEPPEPGVMERPPRDRRQHLITWPLLARAFLWLGLAQALVTMTAFYATYWSHGYWGQWLDLPGQGELYRQASSLCLAAVVATQIGNLFVHRARGRWLGGNRFIGLGLAVEVGFLLLLIYFPPLAAVVGTAPVPPASLLALLGVVPVLPAMEALRRALARLASKATAREPSPDRGGRGPGPA